MALWDVFWAFLLLGVFLLVAQIIKSRVNLLERLYLPSSIVAGFLLLLLGGQGLGRWMPEGSLLANGLVPEAVVDIWRTLPGLLISVVFAALFLGKPIPGLREIWIKAGSQVVFGQTLAWGQYVVGLTLCMLVLTPLFGMNPLAGGLIEISFEGGHGTAAGMAGTFRDLDFPEGADLALGLATVGLVSGVVLGSILINWAVRRGHIAPVAGKSLDRDIALTDDLQKQLKILKQELKQETESTDPLSVHVGLVGVAIGIGWLIQQGLLWIENNTWAAEGGPKLIAYVPLFPLAMIGGVIIQVMLDKTGWHQHISRRLMNRISGPALDFTIVAALGSLSLTAVGQHWASFLLLSLAGVLWNVFGVLFLAPRLIPYNWFPRAIGDFGQSTGVTVTGLLLMRMADPENESGAMESFGYKQLLFEPIVGGGLFTAAALPMIAEFGSGFVLALTAGITASWLLFGYFYFGRMVRKLRQS